MILGILLHEGMRAFYKLNNGGMNVVIHLNSYGHLPYAITSHLQQFELIIMNYLVYI